MPTKKKYPYQNYSLVNIKGEQWAEIPFLDGAYLISNYGRVKALRRWIEYKGYWLKEKILKTQAHVQIVAKDARKQYYLCGQVTFEKNKYTFFIARIVCYLFVEKFDLEDMRIVVNYRDEDPFNIHPGNLFLTTRSFISTETFRKNHRERECFDNKPLPVSQYDLNGKWIASFPSISVAGVQTGIHTSKISAALKSGNNYTENFLWHMGENQGTVEISPVVKKMLASKERYSNIISQYDLKGIKIREYPNLETAARKTKINSKAIQHMLTGFSATCHGYIWKAGSGPHKISITHLEAGMEQRKEKIWRTISQYDLLGTKINTYPSLAEAARQLNVHTMNISTALREEGKRTGAGFLWLYGDGPTCIEVTEKVKRSYFLQQFYNQPVTQYNLQGKRIAIYKSLRDAAGQIKSQLPNFVNAVTGKSLTCAGSYWRLGKGKIKIAPGAVEKTRKIWLQKISKPVIQYDRKGKKIKEYPSVKAAGQATGICASQIGNVAKGKYKLAKGFGWQFA